MYRVGHIMTKRGHQPQRTCLGCGTRDDQSEMIRLAVTAEGYLEIERRRGRGGYLHHDPRCHQGFISRKGQYRAFHVDVSRAAKEKLIEALANRDWE